MSIGIDFGYSHVKIDEIEQNDTNIVIKKIGSKSILEDLNNFKIDQIYSRMERCIAAFLSHLHCWKKSV